MSASIVRKFPWLVLAVAAAVGCGRTELGMRPWHDYDSGYPIPPFDAADVPDVPADDAGPDADADAGDGGVPDDGGADEFTGLSCISAAMCALCCAPDDVMCQFGCINEADPSESGALTAILACAMSSGCGTDTACLLDECSEEIAACGSGETGSGGCLSLVWCLVTAGCTSVPECVDQGMCYQDCFGAARPEVVGAARDLLTCVVGLCMADCAAGLTSPACTACLLSNCASAAAGCFAIF